MTVEQKNNKIDSYKIASLLKGGNFPLTYNYPKEMRATRDLLRRRTGVGQIQGLTILYEIGHTTCFKSVQKFCLL